MKLQPREIADDEYVSQYGTRPEGKPRFRDRPRLEDTDGVSVILGKVAPGEARRAVRRGAPTEEDGVRYIKVGDLRAKGLIVVHTPRAGNTRHASIRYPGEWDHRVAGRFEECCTEPLWYHEQGGGPR